MVTRSSEIREIRKQSFNPASLEIVPSFPKRLTLDTHVMPTLSKIVGDNIGGESVVKVGLDGELIVAAKGSGYLSYETITGNAPVAYGNPHEIVTPYNWDMVYVVVETFDALIRFRGVNQIDWGGDILLKVGVHSIPFKFSGIQIKNRTVDVAVYTLTAFRG